MVFRSFFSLLCLLQFDINMNSNLFYLDLLIFYLSSIFRKSEKMAQMFFTL